MSDFTFPSHGLANFESIEQGMLVDSIRRVLVARTDSVPPIYYKGVLARVASRKAIFEIIPRPWSDAILDAVVDHIAMRWFEALLSAEMSPDPGGDAELVEQLKHYARPMPVDDSAVVKKVKNAFDGTSDLDSLDDDEPTFLFLPDYRTIVTNVKWLPQLTECLVELELSPVVLDQEAPETSDTVRVQINRRPTDEEVAKLNGMMESTQALAEKLSFWIDRGNASPKTVQDVLDAINDLQVAYGGLGLEFVVDGNQVLAMECLK